MAIDRKIVDELFKDNEPQLPITAIYPGATKPFNACDT